MRYIGSTVEELLERDPDKVLNLMLRAFEDDDDILCVVLYSTISGYDIMVMHSDGVNTRTHQINIEREYGQWCDYLLWSKKDGVSICLPKREDVFTRPIGDVHNLTRNIRDMLGRPYIG